MRSTFKQLIWPLFLLLVIVNVYIFISGMKLASEINYYERETKNLHEKNSVLEKKTSSLDSYQHASSIAAQLNFTKSSAIYLENLKYAFNR